MAPSGSFLILHPALLTIHYLPPPDPLFPSTTGKTTGYPCRMDRPKSLWELAMLHLPQPQVQCSLSWVRIFFFFFFCSCYPRLDFIFFIEIFSARLAPLPFWE